MIPALILTFTSFFAQAQTPAKPATPSTTVQEQAQPNQAPIAIAVIDAGVDEGDSVAGRLVTQLSVSLGQLSGTKVQNQNLDSAQEGVVVTIMSERLDADTTDIAVFIVYHERGAEFPIALNQAMGRLPVSKLNDATAYLTHAVEQSVVAYLESRGETSASNQTK